jgi:hypothetical protein
MDDDEPRASLLSALTTEHYVLQAASSSTVAEAGSRSSLYVFALSSALVAMGFAAQSRETFLPFAAVVLPAVFLMGIVTIIRLVDTTLENMQYMAGIARVRSYYRTISADAPTQLAVRHGRWPEVTAIPSLQHGSFFGFIGTTASMVALINSLVGGASAAVLVRATLSTDRLAPVIASGVGCAVLLIAAFLAYQWWRFSDLDLGDATWETEPSKTA